jgi:dolichol-phosphate mannosyltransferase
LVYDPGPRVSALLLSIVVPLLDEAENVAHLHERLCAVAARLDRDVELVLVDDGSTDDTHARLAALRERDPRVKVVRLSRNFGGHGALLAGFSCARGDHAVVLSADLQDPPELIVELCARAAQGFDVVWASREKRDDPYLSVIFSRVYNKLMQRIALPNFPEQGFDFALISRQVVNVLLERREPNTSIFGQILWAGFPQSSVPYARVARKTGRSKWTFWKKVKLAIDSFVSFSYVPIRAISVLGFLCSGLGAAAAIALGLRCWREGAIEGWAVVLVAVLLVGGAQILTLGVLGEYLWRALDQARGRPPFIIASTLGVEEARRP